LSKSQFIWTKKTVGGYVNSMIGLYVFEYETGEKWKTRLLNEKTIEFLPKNEISYTFKYTKVDPRGYIIMPATYGTGILGPFTIMVKCDEKFTFKEI
jgi:hypothetical protein